MQNIIKSTLLPFLASALLAAPAFASDLTDDLRTPFEPATNPFGGVQATLLPSSVASSLRALLERCVVVPTNSRSAIAVEQEARLAEGCENVIQARYETDRNGVAFVSHVVKLNAGGYNLQIVSWDGSYSDGGDQQAIGVYDATGNRIAAFPGVFADGNVLDGIARAVGARLRHVEI